MLRVKDLENNLWISVGGCFDVDKNLVNMLIVLIVL